MCENYSFGVSPITCHAWNKNNSKLVLSQNNNEANIYQKVNGEWILCDVLQQHHLRITSIDWAPETNRIITCSVDRDAYVWSESESGKWKPTIVLLRINRAAISVKWSPKESKFAVGTGAKLISVCYFDNSNNWWISKHIKKPIRSTVTCLDWHPSNDVIVAGSTDFKVRLFCAYIKEIEEPSSKEKWGSKMIFGTLLMEFSNSPFTGGWVHSVSFSSAGDRICWVSHDSSICLVDINKPNPSVIKTRTEHLPFSSCIWVSNRAVVVSGYGCCPMLYTLDESGQFQFNCKLDISQKKEAGGISAMRKFQSLDRQARIEVNDIELDTVHQNAITCMRNYQGKPGQVSKLSTSGTDGQIVLWDLMPLENSIAALRLN